MNAGGAARVPGTAEIEREIEVELEAEAEFEVEFEVAALTAR